MSRRSLELARIPATVRGVVTSLPRSVMRQSLEAIRARVLKRVAELVPTLSRRDRDHVRGWIDEAVGARRAADRLNQNPDTAPTNRTPVSTTWRPEPGQSWRYFTVVVVRDNRTGASERVPVEVLSERPLTAGQVRSMLAADVEAGRIWRRALSPGSGSDTATLLDVVIVTVERGG